MQKPRSLASDATNSSLWRDLPLACVESSTKTAMFLNGYRNLTRNSQHSRSNWPNWPVKLTQNLNVRNSPGKLNVTRSSTVSRTQTPNPSPPSSPGLLRICARPRGVFFIKLTRTISVGEIWNRGQVDDWNWAMSLAQNQLWVVLRVKFVAVTALAGARAKLLRLQGTSRSPAVLSIQQNSLWSFAQIVNPLVRGHLSGPGRVPAELGTVRKPTEPPKHGRVRPHQIDTPHSVFN